MGSPRLAVSLDREGGFRRRGTKLAIAGKHGRHVFAIECTRTAGLATSVSATRLHGPRWISTAIGHVFQFIHSGDAVVGKQRTSLGSSQ